jgi:gamma-glutamyltranspeptidase/glutathione hydrolase
MKLTTIETSFRSQANKDSPKFAESDHGMVASAFPEATQAGVAILQAGGNAVDAACATALALGVCEPQASGIGGQTMAILHIQGRTIAIDGSSRAPSLAHQAHMSKADRQNGYRATTVPSTLAVLGYLNFHYGRLPWDQVCQGAINIARNGYRLTPLQVGLQHRELANFQAAGDNSGLKTFFKSGEPYAVGDLFRQPELAATLTHIAENGPKSFYTGRLAKTMDDQMRQYGGFLRSEDLALIPWPIERKPLHRNYRGLNVVTMPPPAAGLTLLLTLGILRQFPAKLLRSQSPQVYHILAESFRKAFLRRKERPYDPNTYPQNKTRLTTTLARKLAESIRDQIDPDLPMRDPTQEGNDTTHLSVMDHEGNTVGITQSIERVYGAKVVAEGLGFLYNNYMMAMEYNNPAHPYYMRPNSIPWTTVAPAILFNKDVPWMVLGSPGSERIFSTIAQFLIHVLDRHQSMDVAIEQPRFHCSISGRISLEQAAFDPTVSHYLSEMGYKLVDKGLNAFYLGAIHACLKRSDGKGFQGVAEVRRDGTASGS